MREPTIMETRVATAVEAESYDITAREGSPAHWQRIARAAIRAMKIDPGNYLGTEDEKIMNGFQCASPQEWNRGIDAASPPQPPHD